MVGTGPATEALLNALARNQHLDSLMLSDAMAIDLSIEHTGWTIPRHMYQHMPPHALHGQEFAGVTLQVSEKLRALSKIVG